MARVKVLNKPVISRARESDLDALVELEQLGFSGDRMRRRQFRHHLRNENAMVLVARVRSRALGNAIVLFRRNSDVARLYSLVIAPQARGLGLGRGLLASAERRAKSRLCRVMRLEVRVDNPNAISLYESVGYRRIGQRPNYYEDGTDAWRYEKQLGRGRRKGAGAT